MSTEIDVSGHDLTQTLERERRRRAEAEQAKGLNELSALLLPLSVAVARLAARGDVAEALS